MIDERDEKIHTLTLQVQQLSASLERYKAAVKMLTKILDTSNNLIKKLEEIENANTSQRRSGSV